MSPRRRVYLRFLIVVTVLGVTGLASTVYLLVKERAPVPFQDTYTIKAEFKAADAVVGGLGQPVNVVGVKVGQVTGAELVDGRALVTMQIQRGKVARVHRDATAVLEPITPLKDMQINLNPGTARAGPLGNGVLPVEQTYPPVPLSDLLSKLDADARSFVTALIGSLDVGLREREPDLRRMLRALGPTTRQVGRITEAAAVRRRELSRLVHNVARVTRAASRDRRLAALVSGGNRTLQAVAAQDAALREALSKLPATLNVARSTLVHLEPFAEKLDPTLSALLPAVRRLPSTLRTLRPFTDKTAETLAEDIRPLVRTAQPVVRDLGPVVRTLAGATPRLTRSFQVLTYLVNELAYNPEGRDEGFLFWLSWGLHNFNSVISLGDAHGGIGRAQVMANCYGAQSLPEFKPIAALFSACPE